MTWQDVVLIIGVIGIIAGMVLLGIILYVLLSGSYKRYADMRKEHLEQMQQIDDSLQRRRRGIN